MSRAVPQNRPPAVAGTFYPASERLLEKQVTDLLTTPLLPLNGTLRGLISPHAGYTYSGHVAATAFRQLEGGAYDTVILLGPSHRVRFQGVALHAKGEFRTPLGSVPVDEAFCETLMKADDAIQHLPEAHAPEHSLEVQLPFLQKLLPPFAIVPIVMYDFSDETCRKLEDALLRAMDGANALLVVTTDLAHYPAYDTAVRSDGDMIQAIESFEPKELRNRSDFWLRQGIPNLYCTLCGTGPVLTGMRVAAALGATGTQTLKYANSGDIPGADKAQVVGYVASAFVEKEKSS